MQARALPAKMPRAKQNDVHHTREVPCNGSLRILVTHGLFGVALPISVRVINERSTVMANARMAATRSSFHTPSNPIEEGIVGAPALAAASAKDALADRGDQRALIR